MGFEQLRCRLIIASTPIGITNDFKREEDKDFRREEYDHNFNRYQMGAH